MHINKMRSGLTLVATLLLQGTLGAPTCSTQTISRDVVVVGGGAAGAHAAVWLRDHNQTVVVVEKASQLVSFSDLSAAIRVLTFVNRAVTQLLTMTQSQTSRSTLEFRLGWSTRTPSTSFTA